ncbi:CDP-glycerol glycerophosphotransferase family protein [Psychrobacter immobilis]|uniref:CDP-glycerol glycerophosphotransferase family protein n=1 Tax=Psychrobacter immobilis TaxID=498 RepID=UPI001918DAD5|nr:CDP-glycerol glycerophosphotransferase family protein [Psychrobacter immobilis]
MKSIIDILPIEDKAVLIRRINKLKRDPREFIKDSYKKRSSQVRHIIPIKYKSSNDFTVISAVYNVEKYLEEYFSSLTNQSVSFRKHIKLILVDDGSTDKSLNIINKWKKKYPNNIFCISKENGGQASARNLGLDYVKTEWITFIDPDDFVSLNYFQKVDEYLSDKREISLVSCPFIFYYEDLKITKDSHPLRYRFSKNNRTLKIKDMNKDVQLSVNSAFFRYSLIKSSNISFNEDVKPNFEDARFVGDYLLNDNQSNQIGFISKASYFYRKRSDGTSTLDGAWKKPTLFTTVVSEGCLELLKSSYLELGYVPIYIQRTVLYHLSWYFKYVVNNENALDILSESDKILFASLLKEVFSYIENKTIMDFELAGTWFFQKVAWLGSLKNEKPPFQIVYIEEIDIEKKQVLLYYFTYFDVLESITIGNRDIVPTYYKVKQFDFLNENYVYEKRMWVSYDDTNSEDYLKIAIDGDNAILSLLGKKYNKGIEFQKIINSFKSKKYINDKDIWVMMDRDTQADDNAEHFYRYIQNNYPDRKIYFALRKNSHDWERLNKEGFNLLDFGSSEFETVLLKASKLISSHLDQYINDYFGDGFEHSKKFVFLQHGITMNDLSSWVNSKKNLQCFITSTVDEYKAISSDYSRYKLSKKEVNLTGFPRHDSLLKGNVVDSNILLIMPTWRKTIIGEPIDGNSRAINHDFSITNYATHIQSLLNSIDLKSIIENYNYRVVFAPHLNIEPYLNTFNIPDYIEVWHSSNDENSIQELFQKSKIMITDYSSVHFEMAYLDKAVLYYQFDKEDFFKGGHVFSPGYFSYEENGFGPVVESEELLLKEVAKIIENNGEPLYPYSKRIEDTFLFRDANNCKRVYESVIALDEPDNLIDFDIIYQFANQAYSNQDWQLVESRSQLLIEHVGNEYEEWAKSIYIESLFNQHEFSKIIDFLKANYKKSPKIIKLWDIKIAFETANWWLVVNEMRNSTELNIHDLITLAYSASKVSDHKVLDKALLELNNKELSVVQFYMLDAWKLRVNEDWESIIEFLKDKVIEFSIDELRIYQPQVLMAEAYRYLGMYFEAQSKLSNFENHTLHNPRCRIEIARLRYDQRDYSKAVMQYYGAHDKNIELLSESYAVEYVQSLFNENKIEEAVEAIERLSLLYPENKELKLIHLNSFAKMSRWREVIEKFSKIELEQQAELIYPIVLAKYRLGFIDEAYSDSVKPTVKHSYEYWSLIGEIALLVEDIELAKYCYKGMIAIYPEHDSSKNWIRFDSLKNNL